jgi:putative redox protein
MSSVTKIRGVIGREAYRSNLTMRGHTIYGDEPVENGGKDSGPTPTELVLSGLASCTVATLRMYADKKGWLVDKIEVELRIHTTKTEIGQSAEIESIIGITGDVTAEQKQRMLDIARKCPVHKLLSNPIQITSILENGGTTYV